MAAPPHATSWLQLPESAGFKGKLCFVWCDDGDDGDESCPCEGEDVYDSQGVRRECCPGLVESLEDRDPSDPLIGTYPKIIVCRPSRRNLRGTA